MELYTKYRGEEAGYRQAKLEDFMDIMELPQFDHELKWRKVVEKPPRRKINYGNSTIRRSNSSQSKEAQVVAQNPAVRNTGMVRANSNSLTNKELKKHKPSTPSSSSSSSGEEEDMDDDMEDDSRDTLNDTLNDKFSTPTGSKD